MLSINTNAKNILKKCIGKKITYIRWLYCWYAITIRLKGMNSWERLRKFLAFSYQANLFKQLKNLLFGQVVKLILWQIEIVKPLLGKLSRSLYAGFTILDGVSAGQAGKLSRGLIGFAESGKFAWNSIYYGSNAKFTPISKELGLAGGLDMAEVVLVSKRVKLANIAATTIRQGANLVDDAAKGGLSTTQLVQKSATLAERAVGGTGRFAGTAKHTYANNLLSRYQSIYGSRGLQFNNYFNNGVGNRWFLDVLNHGSKTIYDFKFGSATWRSGQLLKYQRNFPGYNIQIIRP